MNLKNTHTLLILSLIGFILILLSPARDLITNSALLLGLLIILIAKTTVFIREKAIIQQLKEISNDKFNQTISIISLVGSILSLVGLLFGYFQSVAWLMFFPFSYYFLVSGVVILILLGNLKELIRK